MAAARGLLPGRGAASNSAIFVWSAVTALAYPAPVKGAVVASQTEGRSLPLRIYAGSSNIVSLP